jgi:hypothetical protein
MKETKKPRGAPKKEIKASARFETRCTKEEKTKWEAAANKAGFNSLSAWLKHLANEYS